MDRAYVIGNQIDTAADKKLEEALLDEDLEYVVDLATEQDECGAEILSVHVALPSIDEADMMGSTIKEIQSYTNVPLLIDTNDSAAAEAGLRYYNGKPILSVAGEDAVLERLLPLVKKYGCAMVGRTCDENGVPASAEDSLAIAKKISARAQALGIPARNIFIELTAEQDVLKAVGPVKEELGLKTALAVSDADILHEALEAGLDLAVLNPEDEELVEIVKDFREN
jgi:5-methyltetrahydrofolate--homocysteine methyltransferase